MFFRCPTTSDSNNALYITSGFVYDASVTDKYVAYSGIFLLVAPINSTVLFIGIEYAVDCFEQTDKRCFSIVVSFSDRCFSIVVTMIDVLAK